MPPISIWRSNIASRAFPTDEFVKMSPILIDGDGEEWDNLHGFVFLYCFTVNIRSELSLLIMLKPE